MKRKTGFIKKFRARRPFIPREKRVQVHASGGGTQSTSAICLEHAGIIPKPDIIVMVNTGRESSAALEYQKKYMMPLCEDMGVDYVIVPKEKYATYDLVGPDPDYPLPGYFTEYDGRKENGDCLGKQPAYCSDKWKTEVMHRYLNERYGEKELTKSGVDLWMGMSLDEANRIKYPSGKWQKRYPLFEMLITRQMAIQIVEDYGLPTPPRSLCWMCPNRDDGMWRELKENFPEDFQRAVEHEKEIQKTWPWLWLHKSGMPLDQIDFKAAKPVQIDLIQFCDTGVCGV